MKKMNTSQDKKQIQRAPTSRDVAKLAGVSQSSVCRVFDKKWNGKISDKLREHVLACAREIGYNPNAIARSLTINRSGIIGVVISEDYNEFYYDLLRHLTNCLQKLDMRVMIFNAAPYRDIDEVLAKLKEYRVDGIIATAAAISCEAKPLLSDPMVPLVFVNIYSTMPFCSSVLTDNYVGSWKMAEYLYDSGCRDYIYISAEKSRYFDIPDRKHGFIEGLASKGCHNVQVLSGDYSYESGLELGRVIFADEHRPEAIFSCGSRMAYGIMDVARHEFGLSIPEDMSIAAYDDTFASSMGSYRLTTVVQPIEELASRAVALLCKELDEGTRTMEELFLMPSLCIRDSVLRR